MFKKKGLRLYTTSMAELHEQFRREAQEFVM
jgi:hypothetical protein